MVNINAAITIKSCAQTQVVRTARWRDCAKERVMVVAAKPLRAGPLRAGAIAVGQHAKRR